MAAQIYVIKSLKKAGRDKSNYGGYQNYALSVEGIGEPVKLSLPEPIIEDPEPGDQLYGRLTEVTSKDGRKYYELKLEPRSAEDIRQRDIHAQGALKLAVQIWLDTPYESKDERDQAYKNITAEAIHLGRQLNIIKQELL